MDIFRKHFLSWVQIRSKKMVLTYQYWSILHHDITTYGDGANSPKNWVCLYRRNSPPCSCIVAGVHGRHLSAPLGAKGHQRTHTDPYRALQSARTVWFGEKNDALRQTTNARRSQNKQKVTALDQPAAPHGSRAPTGISATGRAVATRDSDWPGAFLALVATPARADGASSAQKAL